jgi:hypothetical protein
MCLSPKVTVTVRTGAALFSHALVNYDTNRQIAHPANIHIIAQQIVVKTKIGRKTAMVATFAGHPSRVLA